MRKFISAAGGLALIASLALVAPVSASATAATVTTVTPVDLVAASPAPGQFEIINQSNASQGGGVSIVVGPQTPPLGLGSLQLSIATASDHWSVFNYDHMGTALSAITSLSYSTFTDNATTDPVLQMEINPGNPLGAIDGGRTYSTLNFEPYQQGSPAVTPNRWQPWNVLTGKVWGTHLSAAPQSNPISWTSFLALYPNATIKYGFGVGVGSGWSAMTGAVDALTIGTSATTTTYNFEPVAGTRPFHSSGSGSETAVSGSGCQFTLAGCTVTTSGWATSSHMGAGNYSTSLTVNWSAAYSNGAGGYCAPASGTGQLTAANGATLNQSESGIVCEVGSTSLVAPHTFTGTFQDTGGTGRFSSAMGAGTITGGDDGMGTSYFSEDGTISY